MAVAVIAMAKYLLYSRGSFVWITSPHFIRVQCHLRGIQHDYSIRRCSSSYNLRETRWKCRIIVYVPVKTKKINSNTKTPRRTRE